MFKFIKKWLDNRKEVERQGIIKSRRDSFSLEVSNGHLFVLCDGIACHEITGQEADKIIHEFTQIQNASVNYDENVKVFRR